MVERAESSAAGPVETARLRRRAWQVHAGVLAAWTVVALAAYLDAIGDGGPSGLVLAIVATPLLVYAGATSLIVLFVGRGPIAAVLVHVGVVALWAGCAGIMMAQRRADIADIADAAR